MTQVLTRRQFSVDEYAQMRSTSILKEDDRVELLDGEIYVMSPVGPLHVGLVNKLNRILTAQIDDMAIVSVQNPVRLSDYTEPQPDIALLRHREDYYFAALAAPDDILLIIEIADSSLEYDRNEKLPRYAQASIPELWIVEVNKKYIEQYTDPVFDEYTQIRKIPFGAAISATVLPIGFTTSDLF